MFCHKCGTEIAEGAAFCHKCGTKVATVETEQSTPRETITEPLPVEQNAQPKVIPAAIPSDDSAMFKAYVDNHVRATTKYQSAEELLNCKPMWFVAICFGVCALIGLLLGARLSDPTYLLIGPLVFGGFFGYVVTFITSGIIRMRYEAKYSGKIAYTVDPEEVLAFLGGHLKIVSLDFHQCGFLEIHGGLLAHLEKGMAKERREVNLCAEYKSKKNLAILRLGRDASAPDSGRMQYSASTKRGGFLIDGRAAGFLGHACLIRTAPIMQATMEYYLKYYAKSEGGNENVLH